MIIEWGTKKSIIIIMKLTYFAGRKKVPLLPPNSPSLPSRTRTVSRSQEPEPCEYYDSCDLLRGHPDLKVEPKTSEMANNGPVPSPCSAKLRKISTATIAGLLHSPM